MFKQLCFFRKRPDMSMDEFVDYYENRHLPPPAAQGKDPALANIARYVRRYVVPETNPVTGDVHDPGFHCIMEIWWNSREDFEASQRKIADPARLPAIREHELELFASNLNPICTVIEYDSALGPNGEATHVELRYGD